MSQLDELVKEFFQMLAYMRDNYVRPADQITRMRLSPQQFHILTTLKRAGEPLAMTDLAMRLQISKQQLSPLIAKLIEAGLVVRRVDPDDRRVQLVSLSDLGDQTLHEVRAEIKQAFCRRLEVLPPEDLTELAVLIRRAQEILQGGTDDHKHGDGSGV